MDVGKAIYTLMQNSAEIRSLVDERVFPSRYLNDNINHKVPYITYQRVSLATKQH